MCFEKSNLVEDNNLSASDTVMLHVLYHIREIVNSLLNNVAKNVMLETKVDAFFNDLLPRSQSSNKSTLANHK